jgi:hypothetical protein
VIRLVTALGMAAVTVSCALLIEPAAPAHASPDNCPPACDQIPDSAWIDSASIPLNSTYSWPRLSALAVTVTDPRFRFEELCATPRPQADSRGYAITARATVVNSPGQWQLQAQIFHWRGEVWRAGQLAADAVATASAALRDCQLTAPDVSPSVTTDQPGRLAAVISTTAPAPLVAHQYLVAHPASGTVVELAMWASSPAAVAWPPIGDADVLDALIAPLCTAYIASCR